MTARGAARASASGSVPQIAASAARIASIGQFHQAMRHEPRGDFRRNAVADDAGGVAGHDSVGRDRAADDRARAHDHAVADAGAGEDRGACADPDVVAHDRVAEGAGRGERGGVLR